jgi:predicted nicotinamide N-methyase
MQTHTHTPASRAKDILHCCAASESQQVASHKKGAEETSRDIHSTQDISIYPKMATYLQDDIR